MRYHFSAILAVVFPLAAVAAPVSTIEQRLDKGASRVLFRVKSPGATFDGSFSDVSGKLALNPKDISKSEVVLALNVESVKLPPEQLLPAILVQSVIQRLKSKVATFRSTSFTKLGPDTYDVDGMFVWQGKEKPASVPIQILSSTPQTTRVKCVVKGGLRGSSDPVATALGGNGSGEAVTQLVFNRK